MSDLIERLERAPASARAEKAEAELAKDHDQWERDYIFEQRGAIEARDIKPSGDT